MRGVKHVFDKRTAMVAENFEINGKRHERFRFANPPSRAKSVFTFVPGHRPDKLLGTALAIRARFAGPIRVESIKPMTTSIAELNAVRDSRKRIARSYSKEILTF